MFGRAKVFSSYSVDDIAAARNFYSEVLGLSVSDQAGSLMLHAGDQTVLIYAKPNHTPATFTVLNFDVDDIDNAVNELTAQGVRMERYKEIDTDQRGVYHGDGRSIAWFTDHAGNVLSVVQFK